MSEQDVQHSSSSYLFFMPIFISLNYSLIEIKALTKAVSTIILLEFEGFSLFT